MLRSRLGLPVLTVSVALMLPAQPARNGAGPDFGRKLRPAPFSGQSQFRSTVHTVEVNATVRGADGRFVSGLTKDDFELLDNGKRREITVFAGDVQPIAAALVLDRSGSVARQADQIAASAAAFVDGLLPADQAAIDTLTLECQPLTANKTQLMDVLHGPLQGDDGSPVWSGVDNAISSLSEISGRRAILLFSDGDDYGPNLQSPGLSTLPMPGRVAGPCRPWPDPSEASLTDAARRAGREGILIYTVSVEGPAVQTHDADLRAIARATGGDRYRLKNQDELSAAFGRIVDELHHQYLLGFVPDVLDGKVHTLTVRVKRSGANVRARENYVAVDVPSPASAAAPTAPLGPLTDAEVDQAIRDGSSGQNAQASCVAVGAFRDRPEENQAHAEVLLEGPIGRIMHAARDTRARRETLTADQLAPDMRDPTVLMTADLTTPVPMRGFNTSPLGVPAQPPMPAVSRTAGLSAIIALRLRSPILTERMLRPLVEPPAASAARAPVDASTRINEHYHRVESFDLAAFRALPPGDIEAVVRSVIGARSCVISAKDRAAIR